MNFYHALAWHKDATVNPTQIAESRDAQTVAREVRAYMRTAVGCVRWAIFRNGDCVEEWNDTDAFVEALDVQ